jgi:hypothetical protein
MNIHSIQWAMAQANKIMPKIHWRSKMLTLGGNHGQSVIAA